MKKHETPWLLRIAAALTLFNSWVLFEETIVDRHGLWKYMPCYRVGIFCEWNALAIMLITAALWLYFRRPRSEVDGVSRCWLGWRRCLFC
jgi:hypothetical protein